MNTRPALIEDRSPWPRRVQFDLGPLHVFRNPDAGIRLKVNGLRLGPGQCWERFYRPGEQPAEFCYRPAGHGGRHAMSAEDAVRANREPAA